MRRPALLSTIALAATFGFAGSAFAQKTTLLVYTALETDQLKAYQEGFNKVEPNIEIKWVRDSTGVITAKLLAEKANPQADAVMGVAASSLALLDKNQRIAERNRAGFAQNRVVALNLMSSPGSGKTTLLVRTLQDLAGTIPMSVIEGDQETSADAERIRATGAKAVQINTDNPVIRRNRLNLLSRIRAICLSVADLTKLEG